MIEGINVLNIEPITRYPWYFWVVIVAIAIISLCLISSDMTLFAFLLGLILTSIACTITEPIPTGQYTYEVTIDESVSMTKLYEKYEIVEQRGDLWVLKDREE